MSVGVSREAIQDAVTKAFTDNGHEFWRASEWSEDISDAIIAALHAAGFAVVPVEPTMDMLVAGTEAWLVVRAMEDRAEQIWGAMIAAAKGNADEG
jgi:hypothetical protein